ncbi:MAG: hypothetical protein PHV66_06265 [Bacteroidales bacterium]|nr:hypothetical protein [Bacteroidales bacterium]
MTTHKLASLKQGLPRSQSFLRLLFPVRNDKADLDNRCLQPPLSAAIASLVAAQPFQYSLLSAAAASLVAAQPF